MRFMGSYGQGRPKRLGQGGEIWPRRLLLQLKAPYWLYCPPNDMGQLLGGRKGVCGREGGREEGRESEGGLEE